MNSRSFFIRVLSAGLSATSAVALLLVLAYVAESGSLPNKAGLSFLADNWQLFPLHLLQTAPELMMTLSLGTVVACIASAVISYRTNLHLRAWWIVYTSGITAIVVFGFSELIAPSPDLQGDLKAQEIPQTTSVSAYPQRLSEKVAYSPNSSNSHVNVIVILAESLRHDLLTTYADAAPFLNRLARQSMTFDKAYATSSHSNLTDLAFWYAQYPYRGSGYEVYKPTDPWRGVSMFDAFKASGYKTAYISSQNEKWGGMINWLKMPSTDFYFDSETFSGSTWENHDDEAGLAGLIKNKIATAGKIEDSETLAIAADWLEKTPKTQPIMMGMNLQNTHYSYVVPKGFKGPYQPSELGFKAVYYTWPKEHAEKVRNRYLNAVLGLDAALAAFAVRLQKSGLWDDSLIVIIGDNGEGFYEHGFGNHSGPLYDEATRTLAIIKPPSKSGIPASVVEYPVSHIDLAASTLAMADVAIPGTFQGIPYQQAKDRPVFMYANAFVRQFGVVEWPWKLLITEQPNPFLELFNLRADPTELKNVIAENPEAVRAVFRKYEVWRESQYRYYRESRYKDYFPANYLQSPMGDESIAPN